MSKLNKDILVSIIEELQYDSRSLFSCLMVNRLWCETVIPILWKNPWNYGFRCYENSSLLYVINFYLSGDEKSLTNQEVKLPQFDYLSFCKSININIIKRIFRSSSDYNEFILQQEFYNILMKKCPEFKHLEMKSIEHQIFYFPGAKVRLSSLCELKCDTSIDNSYFYGLAHICQNIQKLIIINAIPKESCGIVKLIEVQRNLKYFEWRDDTDRYHLSSNDFYEDCFSALAKQADTLDYLIMFFIFYGDYKDYNKYLFLSEVLPEFRTLKTLKIDGANIEETFSIDPFVVNTVINIVKYSGGHLREILLGYHNYDYDQFYEDSLILIRAIHENCPLVEYLSLAFPKDHFTEFEKLLKVCQNLKSLLLIIPNFGTHEESYENGENLLKILVKSAPTSLREIKFFDHFKISLKTLEMFLEKWRGRPSLSILTSNSIYDRDDYTNLINKYKNDGVIKDFTLKSFYQITSICVSGETS